MNVAVEDLSTCKKRIKIEVPSNQVNEEWDKVTSYFQREAELPGFRQGKAPKGMVEKRFSRQIEEELKRTLVSRSFREAVKTKNLKVVSDPKIEDLNYQKGLTLSFSTVVDLAPEFSLPDYKAVKVTQKQPESVTDEEVDEMVKKFATQHASYNTIEGREVREGDFVVVDYAATLDGKPIREAAPELPANLAEAKNMWVWIKPDIFLPNFANQLIGAKAGEKRMVNVVFPDDFQTEALRGKTGVYEVQVHELKEQVLPAIDEEFIQKHFQKPLSEFLETVRRSIEQDKVREHRTKMIEEVAKHLEDATNFDLPDSLVDRETRNFVYDIVNENQRRGVPFEMIEEKKKDIYSSATTTARRRVKLQLILSKIAEQEKIEVTSEEINQEIYRIAIYQGVKPQKALEQLERNNGLYDLEVDILNRKTIDFLLQLATKV